MHEWRIEPSGDRHAWRSRLQGPGPRSSTVGSGPVRRGVVWSRTWSSAEAVRTSPGSGGRPASRAVLVLQSDAGNRAVSSLLDAGRHGAAAARPGDGQRASVQRSSFGDAWEATKDVVGGVLEQGWDLLTGAATSEGSQPRTAADLVELEGFDPARHVEVTDPQALLRRPPPSLGPMSGHLIPQGSLVHVLKAVQQGPKRFVLVRDVLDTEPMGWTMADNITGLTLRPRPGGSPTRPASGDADLTDGLTRVDDLDVAFEERTESDRTKIDTVTGLAQNSILAAQQITPERWFADLYPGATFLGKPIKGQEGFRGQQLGGVHKEMYDPLKRAEQLLMAETGKDEEGTATELGLRTIGGLRPGSGSLHTLGLAVDINADRSNPWLRGSSQGPVRRATQLISNHAFDVLADPARQPGTSRERRVAQAAQMYAELTSVSVAVETYLKFRTSTSVLLNDGTTLQLADLADAVAEATGDRRTVAEWQQQITADQKALADGAARRAAGSDDGIGHDGSRRTARDGLGPGGVDLGWHLRRAGQGHHALRLPARDHQGAPTVQHGLTAVRGLRPAAAARPAPSRSAQHAGDRGDAGGVDREPRLVGDGLAVVAEALEPDVLVGQVHERDPGVAARRIEAHGVPAEPTERGEHGDLGLVEVWSEHDGGDLELDHTGADEDVAELVERGTGCVVGHDRQLGRRGVEVRHRSTPCESSTGRAPVPQ